MKYVVLRPRPVMLRTLVVCGAMLAVTLTLLDASPIFPAAIAALTIVQIWQQAQVLRVDAKGVRMRHITFVPWSSIAAVAANGDEVGVRLRPDAPLPAGVTGVVHDPDGTSPIAPGLRMRVNGLDRAALGDAVAAFGGGAQLDYDLDRG